MKSGLIPRAFSLMLLLFCITGPAIGSALAAGDDEEGAFEYTDSFVNVVDENGKTILQTGLVATPGDMFVSEDNIRYEIYAVEGHTARARALGSVDLKSLLGANVDYVILGLLGAENQLAAASGEAVGEPTRRIGVYHSHSDESYVPTSGKALEPWNGDIFQVGAAISNALKRIGISTTHSYNRHDPHDAMAYTRSRRTVVELLKKQPDALLDVHRDTPPRDVYLGEVAGKQIAKVLMVVGRQNPNMPANEQFAFALKDYSDEKFPGLVRGIYYGSGDYNQDLSPRNMLLEMGTTGSTLEEAQNGGAFIGSVVPAVLYGETAVSRWGAMDESQQRFAGENRAGWTTLLALVAVVVLGFGLFLALNEKSWTRVMEAIRRFPGRKSYEGRVRIGPGPEDQDEDDTSGRDT